MSTLTVHRELLKETEAETCEELRQTGLLQALQLYNLMYGGKPLAMGISRGCPLSLPPLPLLPALPIPPVPFFSFSV